MFFESHHATVSKILKLQFVVLVLVTAISVLGEDSTVVVSSFLGGITAFLPNLYFSYRMSLTKGQNAKVIVRSFYAGETRKILLTASLFALAFQYPEIRFLPMLICFVAVLSVFWLALLSSAHDFDNLK